MYTYERLLKLCSGENTDSHIARYLLTHLNSLEYLSMKNIVKDIGISKASIHRFFNKGGYESFKELVQVLDKELKQKERLIINSLSNTKDTICDIPDTMMFDEEQIKLLLSCISQAKTVAFYGNSTEINELYYLFLYLFKQGISVHLLNQWDLKETYYFLETLQQNDILIIVDTNWHIQGLYENSMNTHHMVHLDEIHQYPFIKFFIGEANCSKYLSFHSISLFPCSEYHSEISLKHFDKKFMELLREGDK